MAGHVLHSGATVLCQHGGQAQPTTPLPRVKVDGKSAVGQAAPYTIAGCPLVPTAGGPCATAQWTVAATRVQADKVAVVLKDSTALCVPTGTGLQIQATQTRVKGT
ncbi:MAG TPA: hypothetical protein VGR74_02520 [Actinomycetota bacterium]|jgi:hypothetical protein|nr:hypothetical protein [Actinomycetota bacterium]